MKSLFVLMISAMALHVANGLQEAPLNCFKSEAAADPTIGRKVCKIMREGQPIEWTEKNSFECACALTTHTLWYKRLTSPSIKRLAVVADESFDSYVNEALRKEHRTDALLDGLYDQIEFIKGLHAPAKKSFLGHVYVKLGALNNAQMSPSVRPSFTGQEDGEKAAKSTCRSLLNDKEMSRFILPTLDAIKKDPYIGEFGHHGLIAGVPELARLVGVANMCQSLMGIKAN